ncbi:bifunctional glycosyltransferase family 2 protein/CDP-glycerol:glycerophosphate glycerophosphotransferase [Terribacillus sp. 179-K 1B1 HS]|uniref:bifunctional glycosyltransferase/CDP-glycerol:glycerophosphate glycerophosphotransferase n=1 Tax=Terribacillus sp. 179-K 1B1 HS TaxID=3142388 RepID=UPI0039A2C3BD
MEISYEPSITVVMPVFNVNSYIRHVLDSIIAQRGWMLTKEIIIVDDGSADGTLETVRLYENEYDYIKVLQSNNRGPGYARNEGMKLAQGEYIAFADGDDFIPAGAYAKMLHYARHCEADIVVGNVQRFSNARGVFNSGLHKKIFEDTQENTHILQYHNLLYDTTSWNKLFRRSFLMENRLVFPEDVLYEDIPFNMAAHLLSSRTAIIENIVYHWRLRDGLDRSITQSRDELKNFHDRMQMVSAFDQIIEDLLAQGEDIPAAFLEAKERKILTLDLMLFIDTLEKYGRQDQLTIVTVINSYLDTLKTDVLSKLIAKDRIKYHYIKDKDLDGLLGFLQSNIKFTEVPVTRWRRKKRFKLQKSLGAALPLELSDVEHDISPFTKIKEVSVSGTKLSIDFVAFLRRVNSKKVAVRAFLEDINGQLSQEIDVTFAKNKRNTLAYGEGKKSHLFKRFDNYDRSDGKIVIDFTDDRMKAIISGDAKIRLAFSVNGSTYSAFLANPVKGNKPRPLAHVLEDTIYKFKYNAAWQLKIKSEAIEANIADFRIEKDTLLLQVKAYRDRKFALQFTSSEAGQLQYIVKPQTEEDGKYLFAVDMKQADLIRHQFDVQGIYLDDMDVFSVPMEDTAAKYIPISGESKEVQLLKDTSGNLSIRFSDEPSPFLRRAAFVKDKLQMTVEVRNQQKQTPTQEMLLIKDQANALQVPAAAHFIEGGRNVLSFEVSLDRLNDELTGNSSLHIFLTTAMGEEVMERPIISSEALIGTTTWYRSELKLRSNASSQLRISRKRKKTYFEDGPRRQMLLERYIYPLMRALPMRKNYIMMESFWGRTPSCNPLAIYDYMQNQNGNYKFIFSTNDPLYKAEHPNAVVVNRLSFQYYYYLAVSKFFINNVNWPLQYKKRKQAVEIQTLHGTFLKTMGLDVKNEVDTQKKLRDFRIRHGRWDYLISPSPFMTETARRVFEYKDKPVLEIGTPRNDILFNADEDKIAAIKKEIGIPADKKVILYAPTYRAKTDSTLHLEIEKLKEQLGDEYILLIRMHYFVSGNIRFGDHDGFVMNMAKYPNVNELYLISDIMITDYSSTMFDYAIARKPMIFFTYDYQYYKNDLRGMYLDFEKEAPGPLFEETSDIVDYILHIDERRALYADKEQHFIERYAQFENGDAAKQVHELIANLQKNRSLLPNLQGGVVKPDV